MRLPADIGTCHGRVNLPWRSLLLTAVAVIAYLALGAAPGDWVFDRTAIAQGEWWRLITGHWVHSDLTHASWDIAALLLLGVLFEARLKWHLLWVLLLSGLGIDVWLWWGDPALHYYCGLSGVLNGLLVVGLLSLWRDTKHPVALLTAAGAVLKIAVEINVGQAVLVQTVWPSTPAVHAVGFLSGLVFAAWLWISGVCFKKPRENSDGKSTVTGSAGFHSPV